MTKAVGGRARNRVVWPDKLGRHARPPPNRRTTRGAGYMHPLPAAGLEQRKLAPCLHIVPEEG
jgi:hypothetical protein